MTALLAFAILGCNLELFSSISTPPAAPTATPILTPTPLPTISANNLALIDAAGLDFAERRVIGINTAIFSPSGTSSSGGFAIPVDTIRWVLPDLLTLRRYRHPCSGRGFGATG